MKRKCVSVAFRQAFIAAYKKEFPGSHTVLWGCRVCRCKAAEHCNVPQPDSRLDSLIHLLFFFFFID